jgi:hypothetical protein
MVARAKSTARAEARRRHRAAQAQMTADDTAEVTAVDPAAAAATMPARRTFLGMPVPDFRGDVRALPHELRTNRWWWLSTVLLLTAPVAFAIALNSGEDEGGMFSLYVRLMVSPPAIPILVAGFMSRRGPYLIGLLLGVIDGILIAAFQSVTASSEAPTSDVFLVGSVSVLSAAVLGGAFGWIAFIYRGWLQNSSRRRDEAREKRAQDEKRKARDEARQARSGR